MNIPSGGWIIAAAAAAAAAFVLDLLTPLGMVVPMLYVLSILLTRRIPGRRSTVFLAVGVVSLTWAGVVLSSGDATPVVAGNRAMASFLLVVVAGLVLKEKHLAQRHDADQAVLRESEERLVLALDGAAMGTWDWDLETDSLRWNERQFALFGIKTEDFHGTGAEALARIHVEDRPRIDAAVRRVLEEHGCFTEEFRVVHADGSVHWLFGSGRAEQLQDGRFRRVLGVNFDITERKRAEEAVRRLNETLEQRVGERTAALKAAEEWFRGIFDHAAEGIAIRDLEGRYVQCNAAYTAIVGYTEHELETLEFQSLIHPDDRLQNQEFVRQLLNGDIPSFELENRYIKKSGRPVWVQKHASIIRNDQGAPTHLLVLVTNITQRKRDEEELLRQRARLEDLASRLLMTQDEERRRIARELHDDHMQRLAALALDLHQLSRSLPTAADEAKATITQYARSVEQLTTELQHFAHQLHPSTLAYVGLEAALSEHVEDFQRRTGLEAELEVCNVPDPLSDEQSVCLFRVVQECLQNVRKHANASKVLVRLLGTRRGVGVCVHDDGRGFDTAQECVGGRKGMGLISLGERLGMLNGTFRLRTKPGNGTEVHAWIPLEHDEVLVKESIET